jgi:hypothetical protein
MWRSLVAHLTGGQGVAGSNPVIPTTSSFSQPVCGLVVLRISTLLMKPVFADCAGVVILGATLQWTDGAIREQGAGNRDQADDDNGHVSIMRHSSRRCNTCRAEQREGLMPPQGTSPQSNKSHSARIVQCAHPVQEKNRRQDVAYETCATSEHVRRHIPPAADLSLRAHCFLPRIFGRAKA